MLRNLLLLTLLLGASVAGAQPPVVLVLGVSQDGAAVSEPAEARLASALRQRQEVPLGWDQLRQRLRGQARSRQGDGSDTVAAELKRARQLYLRQAFGQMTTLLTGLERRQLHRLSRTGRRRQAASLNQLLGLAYHARAKQQLALERFALAGRLAPGQTLDAALYPPQAVALARQAADGLRDMAQYELRLSGPAGLMVTVDGQALATRHQLSLRAGLHYLRLERPGEQPVCRVLQLRGHQQLRYQAVALQGAPLARQLLRMLEQPRLWRVRAGLFAALARASGARAVVWWRPGPSGTVSLGRVDAAGEQRCPAQQVLLADAPHSCAVAGTPGTPQRRPAARAARPWWKRWWVWAIVGGVGLAGATTAVVLTTRSPETVVDVRVR